MNLSVLYDGELENCQAYIHINLNALLVNLLLIDNY